MVKKITYSVKETAEALGISRSLLYRQLEEGTCEIPYRKVGNRFLFPIKALEDYFNSCNNEIDR